VCWHGNKGRGTKGSQIENIFVFELPIIIFLVYEKGPKNVKICIFYEMKEEVPPLHSLILAASKNQRVSNFTVCTWSGYRISITVHNWLISVAPASHSHIVHIQFEITAENVALVIFAPMGPWFLHVTGSFYQVSKLKVQPPNDWF